MSVLATAVFIVCCTQALDKSHSHASNPWQVPQYYDSLVLWSESASSARGNLEWSQASPTEYHAYGTLPICRPRP